MAVSAEQNSTNGHDVLRPDGYCTGELRATALIAPVGAQH